LKINKLCFLKTKTVHNILQIYINIVKKFIKE
jgi:hypothetical protein